MSTDRRLLKAINGVLLTLALGAVVAIAWVVHQTNHAQETPVVAPDETAFRTAIRQAEASAKLGRFAEAESAYQTALRLRPESIRVRLEVGDFYDDHGQDGKSLAEYRQVLAPALRNRRVSPSMIPAVVRYGDLLLRLRDESGARRAYETAVYGAMPPPAPRTLAEVRSRACLQAASVSALRASDLLRRGIALDPRNWREYGLGQLRRWWTGHPVPEAWVRFPPFPLYGPPQDGSPHDSESMIRVDEIGRKPGAMAFLRRTLGSTEGVERTALRRAILAFERENASQSAARPNPEVQ